MSVIAVDYFSQLFAVDDGSMDSILNVGKPIVDNKGDSLLLAPSFWRSFTLLFFKCISINRLVWIDSIRLSIRDFEMILAGTFLK